MQLAQVILVVHGGKQVQLRGVVKPHLVDVPPRAAKSRKNAANLLQLGQVTVKFTVVVPDVLVRALLEELEKVAHVLPGLDHLFVQVALGDPSHIALHAVGVVQGGEIQVLRITPGFPSEVVVEHQGLLVGLQACDTPPGLDLPQVTSGLGPISVLLT